MRDKYFCIESITDNTRWLNVDNKSKIKTIFPTSEPTHNYLLFKVGVEIPIAEICIDKGFQHTLRAVKFEEDFIDELNEHIEFNLGSVNEFLSKIHIYKFKKLLD